MKNNTTVNITDMFNQVKDLKNNISSDADKIRKIVEMAFKADTNGTETEKLAKFLILILRYALGRYYDTIDDLKEEYGEVAYAIARVTPFEDSIYEKYDECYEKIIEIINFLKDVGECEGDELYVGEWWIKTPYHMDSLDINLYIKIVEYEDNLLFYFDPIGSLVL